MARAVMAGVDPASLGRMSFSLLSAVAEEHRRDARRLARRRKRQAGGVSGWDWRSIPEPADPDAPPDKDLFVNYGMAAGAPREWCEAEYARQAGATGGSERPDRR